MSAIYLVNLSVEDWNELARTSKFDLDVLCFRLKISRRTLERHFLKSFSESPAAWTHRQRLETSVQLLKKGLVAKEICVELGFTTETNFSHQFHRHFGCAPREYLLGQSIVACLPHFVVRESLPSV